MKKFTEKYNLYRSLTDEKLNNVLKDTRPENLYDPIRHIFSGGGKRIRPVLLMFSCEAVGGNYTDAIDASVAVELLHNFTLVHDDIMDNADTRRGKQTIHNKWDVNTAILSGDALLGLAYRSLLGTKTDRIYEIVNTFTEGIIEVCEGQSYDKEFEMKQNVSMDEYIMMIEKKTSRLLETSAVIGALIGKANPSEVRSLRNYALNLGVAFQIQDDLLDIAGEEKETGKKTGGDLVEGKKTFLLIKAAGVVDNPDDREEIFKIIKNNGLGKRDEEKILLIKQIYKKYNIINAAKEEVIRYTQRALEHLSEMNNSESIEQLEWFSQMLLGRNS